MIWEKAWKRENALTNSLLLHPELEQNYINLINCDY